MRPKGRFKKIDSSVAREKLRLQQLKIIEQARARMRKTQLPPRQRAETNPAKLSEKQVTVEDSNCELPEKPWLLLICDRHIGMVYGLLIHESLVAALVNHLKNLPDVEESNWIH